jgi:transcriptional regulator GlxA family with amidase domain
MVDLYRDTDTIDDLHLWLCDNLGADLGVARLAERVRMSPRHFDCQSVNHLPVSPAI